MELKQFVSSSLVQIIEGVSEARSQLKDTNAVINPVIMISSEDTGGKLFPALDTPENKNRAAAVRVDFDVAVTVSEDSKSDVGGKLKVAFASLGSSIESSSLSSSISRLSFSVPIQFAGENRQKR